MSTNTERQAAQASFCVTCHHQKVTSSGTRKHFGQSYLQPAEDELGFGEETQNMIRYIRALFYAIGYRSDGDPEEMEHLGQLGVEVAEEAQRRMELYQSAVNMWHARAKGWEARVEAATGKDAA